MSDYAKLVFFVGSIAFLCFISLAGMVLHDRANRPQPGDDMTIPSTKEEMQDPPAWYGPEGKDAKG